MNINYLHDFTQKTENEFLNVQNSLKNNVNINKPLNPEELKTVAGIDIAYWSKDKDTYGVCCIVIIDFNTKKVLEKVHCVGKIEVPYIAGYLAFRELPLILQTIKKISIEPDLFIFDGNGYLHYNNMGIATHAGLFINKPTMGIAKSYLKIRNAKFVMPANEIGAFTNIEINDQILGRVLRTKIDVKPVFISCGNNINLDSCYNITMKLLSKNSKVPIPTRLADLETHLMRNIYNQY